MAIKVEEAKDLPIYDDNAVANESLASYVNCLVAFSATASGKFKLAAPGSQGTLVAGVLLPQQTGTYGAGDYVPIRMLGCAKIKAAGAFNSGIEVCLYDSTGAIAAASSGDYVIGISREAATAAGHLVSVIMTGGYWKA